jgi:hypothetical protein
MSSTSSKLRKTLNMKHRALSRLSRTRYCLSCSPTCTRTRAGESGRWAGGGPAWPWGRLRRALAQKMKPAQIHCTTLSKACTRVKPQNMFDLLQQPERPDQPERNVEAGAPKPGLHLGLLLKTYLIRRNDFSYRPELVYKHVQRPTV